MPLNKEEVEEEEEEDEWIGIQDSINKTSLTLNSEVFLPQEQD